MARSPSRSSEPQAPFPGAPANRLHGRYAVCTFAGIGNLKAFDWEVEIRTEFADATAHGDFWDIPVPLKYLWTARIRGYFDTVDFTYLHAYGNAITATPTDIAAASFIGFKDSTGSVPIFTGSGFLVRARFSAPMAMVEQEAEIRGASQPGTTAF